MPQRVDLTWQPPCHDDTANRRTLSLRRTVRVPGNIPQASEEKRPFKRAAWAMFLSWPTVSALPAGTVGDAMRVLLVWLGMVAITANAGAQLLFTGPRAVVQLRIESDKEKEALAAGVLIHREDGPQGVVLYFLTSESLLRPAAVSPSTLEPRGEGEDPRNDASLNIAVLRLVVERSALVPTQVALDPPREGSLFFIVTYTAAGARIVSPQRFRRISLRSAGGDLEMPWAVGCVGAPAFAETGVFGIVSECGAAQPPTITLLSAARGLLRRLVPGLDLGRDGSRKSGIGN